MEKKKGKKEDPLSFFFFFCFGLRLAQGCQGEKRNQGILTWLDSDYVILARLFLSCVSPQQHKRSCYL